MKSSSLFKFLKSTKPSKKVNIKESLINKSYLIEETGVTILFIFWSNLISRFLSPLIIVFVVFKLFELLELLKLSSFFKYVEVENSLLMLPLQDKLLNGEFFF